MTPNSPEILRERSLKDDFFRREGQALDAASERVKAAEDNREALAKASGITKPAVSIR